MGEPLFGDRTCKPCKLWVRAQSTQSLASCSVELVEFGELCDMLSDETRIGNGDDQKET